MIKNLLFLLPALLLCGCAPASRDDNDARLDIRKIHVDSTSKAMTGEPAMITRCTGFRLSEKQVRDFLMFASRVTDDSTDKYIGMLPCSSTGTATVNRRKYDWTIRAGGIGVFSGANDHFVLVCGKNCCEKVPGVC
jgi:hypothetical protein